MWLLPNTHCVKNLPINQSRRDCIKLDLDTEKSISILNGNVVKKDPVAWISEFPVIICKKKNSNKPTKNAKPQNNFPDREEEKKKTELPVTCESLQQIPVKRSWVHLHLQAKINNNHDYICCYIYQYYNYSISHNIFYCFASSSFFTKAFNFQVHLVQQSVVHIT